MNSFCKLLIALFLFVCVVPRYLIFTHLLHAFILCLCCLFCFSVVFVFGFIYIYFQTDVFADLQVNFWDSSLILYSHATKWCHQNKHVPDLVHSFPGYHEEHPTLCQTVAYMNLTSCIHILIDLTSYLGILNSIKIYRIFLVMKSINSC